MNKSHQFHPDKNLPGCMMPDGGECCAGHAAVVEDWHKQRREIERLRAAIEAMREPTVAMLDAARDWSIEKYHRGIGDEAAIGCWHAMIDAALEG